MILRLATRAMGTRFELVLNGRDEPRLRAAGEEALAEIDDCGRRLSFFRRDSVVSHVNRHAGAGWTVVDAEVFGLLRRCAALHASSGGAFDPTVAPLMTAVRNPGGEDTSPDARASVGWDHVELDPARRAVRFAHPDTAIDLGAIGKGFGLDRAAHCLRESGVETALLHGGTSTTIAIGSPPGQDGWCVSIGVGASAPVAQIADRALSVSAQWGRPGGHVLDPHTGSKATGPILAAVIAADATSADAWSTALLVRGDLAGDGVDSLTADGTEEAPRWRTPRPGSRFTPRPVTVNESS